MMHLIRPIIAPGLSPNTTFVDIVAASKIIARPWKWATGGSTVAVEQWFSKFLGTKSIRTFDSGRSALLALLYAFGIGGGDEVIVQAFTCVAVPNSVLWAGATPIYVDIDPQTLNIDPADLKKKITKHTKAIVVQHTFGQPADMHSIMEMARAHGIVVIEDCAHSLGATYKGRKVGTLGDAAFFSFGRDKVLSSVWGGLAAISSEGQDIVRTRLFTYHKRLSYPSSFWIFQQLLHPLAFAFIIPTYRWVIGKVVLVLLQKLHLLSVPVADEEKKGKKPTLHPARYPNALARLAIVQLRQADTFAKNRKEIAQFYTQALTAKGVPVLPFSDEYSYLRFSVFVDNPTALTRKAKRNDILLGSWYRNTIDPVGVDFVKVGYEKGSCPNAETVASQIVNLPTRIPLSHAREIVALF